ncbi:MAG: hypothetical protein KME42_28325 [Tildeniella nuda ZEHNDER 1965/U140]|jgi:hypothetical protein|nr:hypothetical protein [Tildeniella nuda ZEHNDER 1965/U140]
MVLTARVAGTGERIAASDFDSGHAIRMKYQKDQLISPFPDCDTPVFVRDRGGFTLHFVHKTAPRTNFNYHPESVEHLRGKQLIAESFRADIADVSEAEVTFEYPIGDRIADVAVIYPTGWVRVGECQLVYDSSGDDVEFDIDDPTYGDGLTIRYLLKPLKDESWQREEEACTDSITYRQLTAKAIAHQALKVQIGYTQETFKTVERTYGNSILRSSFYRSLEIWGALSTQEIQRALKATPQGKRSIAGLLGAANNHGLVKTPEGKWQANAELIERSHLQPLPIAGIAAAKSRALQLKKKA